MRFWCPADCPACARQRESNQGAAKMKAEVTPTVQEQAEANQLDADFDALGDALVRLGLPGFGDGETGCETAKP